MKCYLFYVFLLQCTMEFALNVISMLLTLRLAEVQKCFKVTDLVKGQCTFYNSSSVSPKEQLHNAAARPHPRILILFVFLRITKYNHNATFASKLNPPPFTIFFQAVYHTMASKLNCSKLPSPPQVCRSPPLSSTSPSPVSVPVSSSLPSSRCSPFSTSSPSSTSPPTLSAFSPSFNSPLSSTQDLILAVSLPLLCLAVLLPLILLHVRRLLFPRSQPPTTNDNIKHFYSPHSTAISYSIIIINATVFASTITNTNAYWQIL